MIKVHMLPTPDNAKVDITNSINHIVLKLQKHLSNYGVELVNDSANADLIAAHAGQAGGIAAVDVAHCHGLYPTAYPELTDNWHLAANRGVVSNLVGAKAVTVPSQWVGDILRRDMHIDPIVVGWAIDGEDWEPGENYGYILWNKTRTDGVCSPSPVEELARRAGNYFFVSTFGSPAANMKIIGRTPYDEMKPIIRSAGVYLATTKETFGIGTLEAMACGIPILGFKHGGTADIVQHGVSGYLVEPGDFEGLREGLDWCLKHRTVLGANARAVALTYTWDRVASQFAQLYQKLLIPHVDPKVSVVIPCYNYARFVSEAIESVSQQVPYNDVEIIIVNDGSTDGSLSVIEDSVERYCTHAKIINTPNSGVASARNIGISAAKGKYIVCLDADDRLGSPLFVKTLAEALDNDPALGIAFSGITVMNEDGQLSPTKSIWPAGYDFDQAIAGHNQVPTCCMFRKEAWLRAGGYKARYTPAEDARLWLTIGSLGYRAKHVVDVGWFYYRMHGKSLSSPVRVGKQQEPNWRDFNWITDGQRPFASDGNPPRFSWPVRNYDRPKISIIIPVGPYHETHLFDALDSIENQSERYWEVIVVNDTGRSFKADDFKSYPYVKVIETAGELGAAKARNIGIAAAIAPMITFLDADDSFHPAFLESVWRAYSVTGKYVYTDWWSQTKDGAFEVNRTPEYDPNMVFRHTSVHSINILIPKQTLLDCGGFDESFPSWEDVDLFMNLAARGYCGVRVAEPLVLYRYNTGQLRERGEIVKDDLIAKLREKYTEFIVGGKDVCCGNTRPVGTSAKFTSDELANGADQLVRIVYNGAVGNMDIYGPVTKQRYGRHTNGDTFFVYLLDQQYDPDKFQLIAEPDQTINPTSVPADPTLIGG